jgi:four helix bundle protein
MPVKYDLEERTEKYAKDVIALCKTLSKNTINIELISQLVRAAGSVGANYIEANESLSKKDFFHRIKICRKEAKESRYWLHLVSTSNVDIAEKANVLAREATELTSIFGAILKKAT